MIKPKEKGVRATEQTRVVETDHGVISYVRRRKRVKNLNLRVGSGGMVFLSVPLACPDERADNMIREKSGWILLTSQRVRERESVELFPAVDRKECRRLLGQALVRMYPLVAPYGVDFPELKVRKMRSQWGNCHWVQGYITLNAALSRCPEELRDYVALHELVHFLHHDHGTEFYAVMTRLMPDWKVRRQELKRWGAALITE